MLHNYKKGGITFFYLASKSLVTKMASGVLLGSMITACSDPIVDETAPIETTATTQTEKGLALQRPADFITLQAHLDDGSAPAVGDRRAPDRGKPDKGRFNITLKFQTPVTERQLTVFDDAAGRWERIIIGDVPSVTGTIPSAFVGFPPIATNETIDDIIIEVAIAPIDGPGNILGQAGPVYIRNVDHLTLSGVMFFDIADLELLDGYELFDDVIVHEMGHVLGVGTLWDYNRTLLKFNSQGAPYFNGKLANLLWKVEGGRASLPIEDLGGPGTALSHWKESILNNELMTGFINLGTNPLSRITSASVRDLGYVAIPTGEKYDLPRNTPGIPKKRLEAAGIDIEKGEVILKPIGVVVAN